MSQKTLDILIMKHSDQVNTNIAKNAADMAIQRQSMEWILASARNDYSYNFSWLDRPIIQYPQDVVAMQELIWKIRPDLIIETGIAHGGSLVFSASLLALIEYCDAARNCEMLDPENPTRKVIGVDIDIRQHNRAAIENHPMAGRIHMIQGSSIDRKVIQQIHHLSKGYKKILVCLDSMHTHNHVLAELEAYAPLVSKGSYCVVFDTIIEDMPEGFFSNRPWNRGNNPKTAVFEFIKRLNEKRTKAADGSRLKFEIDKRIENKLLITVAPDGYLKRC